MNQGALTSRNIVITRPLGQANRLSSLIQEAGGNVHLFPLLEIVPLADYQRFDEKIAQLHQFDWAVFISSNAVQHSLPRIIEKLGTPPKKLKFAAIGPQTAADLAKFGIQNTLTRSRTRLI